MDELSAIDGELRADDRNKRTLESSSQATGGGIGFDNWVD